MVNAGLKPTLKEIKTAYNLMRRRKGFAQKPAEFDQSSGDVIAWVHYNSMLKESCLMDFDDVLIEARLLLQQKAHVRGHIQRKFSHMLVDEVQDSNEIQVHYPRIPSRPLCHKI